MLLTIRGGPSIIPFVSAARHQASSQNPTSSFLPQQPFLLSVLNQVVRSTIIAGGDELVKDAVLTKSCRLQVQGCGIVFFYAWPFRCN